MGSYRTRYGHLKLYFGHLKKKFQSENLVNVKCERDLQFFVHQIGGLSQNRVLSLESNLSTFDYLKFVFETCLTAFIMSILLPDNYYF